MKCAFIFPGQGSQSLGMGKSFYDEFPIAKTHFEEASDTLSLDMKDLLFNQNDKLNLTKYTQPAIFLVSYVAYKIFESEYSIKPTIALGHSLGELSAVAVSGGMSFGDAMRVTYKRGELMAKACEGAEAGMMVIVGLDDSALEGFCDSERKNGKQIWCANYNGDGQVVLAGKKADLSACESALKSMGAKRALLLPMSVASHCPMLESISADFSALLDSVLNDSLNTPILSNATLELYTTKPKAKELLTYQLTLPVKYKQSIKKIDDEVDLFIEFGNGSVLKGLNKRLSQHPTHSIGDSTSLKETLNALQNTN